MRKVSKNAANAFMTSNPQNWKESNTEVIVFPDGIIYLKLFGNVIAERKNGKLFITNAGWATPTTKERLNALPGVNIGQTKGVCYLNGNKWDGNLIEVKPCAKY